MITASADDDQGVSQVAFYLDGASLGVDSNGSDGWSLAWDTTTSADGEYTLRVTATDTAGQTAFDQRTVTVSNGSTSQEIVLTINTSSMFTLLVVRLSWTGATTSTVDIYRNDSLRWTTGNDGSQAEVVMMDSGSYSYMVCESGTSICSNVVTVDS